MTELRRKAGHSFRRGQSLAEYGIITSLVALGALGGVLILGGGIQKELWHIFAPQSAPAVAAAPLAGASVPGTKALPGTAPTSSVVATGPTAAGAANLTLTLGNGQQLQLSNYPVDVTQSVLTAGANGTTNMLLGNLDTVIQHLKDSGALTAVQSDALTQLANQGHFIGKYEDIVQNAIASATPATVDKLTGTLDGKTMELGAFYGEIGYNSNDPANGDEQEAQRMRTLYNSAVSSGALSDPVAQQTVNTLVNQILNIANGVENSADAVSEGNLKPTEFNSSVISEGSIQERDMTLNINTQQGLLAQGAAAVTHQDSAQICTTGQGDDAGTHCN